MEREAKEGGDTSFEFVFPNPVFVVELTEHGRATSKCSGVFVNICQSEKIAEFTEQTTGGRMGSHWHVPVSVGKLRREPQHPTNSADSVGVDVYDAVFHPKTVKLANSSDKFMCFLIEIVVENINEGYKEQFGFQFRRLSTSFKSVGTPANQTVRKGPTDKAAPGEVSLGPIRASLPSSTTSSQAAAAAPPQQPWMPPAEVHHPPKYTIAHRGMIDLSDAWQWNR